MPDPLEPADPVTEALATAAALKALGASTARLSQILGIDVRAASNGDPTKPQVALALPGSQAVVIGHAGSQREAAERWTKLLETVADAVEARWRARVAPRAPVETKTMPSVAGHQAPSVRRIGGSHG